MYFVDFVAVNLVSCIVIIAGLFEVFDISLCRFGSVVFSDEALHVIMCVLRFVVWFVWGYDVGVMGSGRGWEYSGSGSLHFNDSISRFSGKKGNCSDIDCIVSGTLLCLIKS